MSIRFCYKNKDFIDKGTLKLLYFSLLRSLLEYALGIWSAYYKIQLNNLEQTQRRFLKFSSVKEDGAYPSLVFPQEDMLNRFPLTSLENRRSINELTFLFKEKMIS